MSPSYPRPIELVPHSGPMCLLSRVLEHEASRTTCEARVDASGCFCSADGSVPAWLALEYMAQCAAVHGGLRARRAGAPPRPGLFLGSRRAALHVDEFPAGARLWVTARHHRGETGLVAFDCEVVPAGGGAPLAEGRLSVLVFEDWAELEERLR